MKVELPDLDKEGHAMPMILNTSQREDHQHSVQVNLCSDNLRPYSLCRVTATTRSFRDSGKSLVFRYEITDGDCIQIDGSGVGTPIDVVDTEISVHIDRSGRVARVVL